MHFLHCLLQLLLCVLPLMMAAQSGSLDMTFGQNGKTTAGFGRSEAYARAIAVQPDGKIICGGDAYNANTSREFEGDSYNALMYRYHPDGSLDTTFGDHGMVLNKYESSSNESRIYTAIYYIHVLDNGKILTYGYYGVNVQWGGLMICRYHPDGTLDTSFGSGGRVFSSVAPPTAGTPMVVQDDQKIVVLGGYYVSSPFNSSASFFLERYHEDGSLDTLFGTNGQIITTFGFQNNYPSCIALQADGKILASGQANGRNLIARYLSNGALDPSFDGDGKVVTMFGLSNNNALLTAMPNGKIQLAGLTTTSAGVHFSISQYQSNGSLDLTFDGDGRTLSPFPSDETSIFMNAVAKSPDGKFLVCTQNADNYNNFEGFVMRRYLDNGILDNSFGVNGTVTTLLIEGSHVGKFIYPLASGKTLLAGYAMHLDEFPISSDFNVMQYTNNGNLDPEFNGNGIVTEYLESSNDNGRIVLTRPDGQILLIGVQRYNEINTIGSSDIIMAQYDPNGALDNAFGENGKIKIDLGPQSNSVRKAGLQPDGKLLILNQYYTFPSTTGHQVIRFDANGAIDTSFGADGVINLTNAVYTDQTALHVQEDGSFYTITYGYNPIDNTEPFAFYLTSFDSEGHFNTSFGNGGTAFVEGTFFTGFDPSLLVQSDGKIILSTSQPNADGSSGIALTRFTSDGVIDETFVNEPLTVDVQTYPYAIFLDDDDKIIVTGISEASSIWYLYFNFVIARYQPDGSVDSTYGTNGIHTAFLGDQIGFVFSKVQSILRQADGKFLVGLTRRDANIAFPEYALYDFAVSRFTAQGEYDSSFGEDGKVFFAFFSKYDELYSMALQGDHKIIVAGTTDNGVTRDFALARLENCLNVSTTVQVSLCAGETYALHDTVYATSGIYTSTLPSALGCDSLVTLHLDILPALTSDFNVSLCAGETYTWNNVEYAASGTYPNTFTAAGGCDSLVTLHLEILPTLITDFNVSLCAGETYTWNNMEYATSGTYPNTFTAAGGCDSLVTLHLDILPALSSDFNASLCAGETYTWNNMEYAASGTYANTFTAAGGCDSLVTLHLEILPALTSDFDVILCAGETFAWNNMEYAASGTYPNTFTAAGGCDSLVTLHLEILPAISSAIDVSLCAGETLTINNETFSASGTYTTLYQNDNGCDSTVTITLFIDTLQADLLSSTENLIAIDYPNNATFQWLDCTNDLAPIAGATNSIFAPTENGSYAVEVSNEQCSAISTCEDFVVNWIPFTNPSPDVILALYPNPSHSSCRLVLSPTSLPCAFRLIDSRGRTVEHGHLTQSETWLDVRDIDAGLYQLILQDQFNRIAIERLIRE